MPRHEVRVRGRYPAVEQLPPPELPEVALLGRSNVGKSSLLNRLTGSQRAARTSKKPGCTRTLDLYIVDGRLLLVDLPGYGYARTGRAQRINWERELIPGYLSLRQSLRGSILLVDSRHPGMDSDSDMARFLLGIGKPYVIALTKMDKLRSSARRSAVEAARELGPVLPVSAVTGEGIPSLWSWVFQATAG